jgi:aryl carrier-like protein
LELQRYNYGQEKSKKEKVKFNLLNLQDHKNRIQMASDTKNDDKNNILNGLQSEDSIKVIETLEELRVSGKVSDIPMLVEILHLTQNPEIKSKVAELFANLKESDAIPLIVEAIQNQKYAPELKELVSSCWENGLDYSNYLSLFIGLLIDCDFLIAFEAYTVIMNTISKIDQTKIDMEIDRLEKALPTTEEHKRQLILDVIDFLPSIGY